MTLTVPSAAAVAAALGDDSTDCWHKNCHSKSLQIVRSGVLGTPGPACRVVRGVCHGYEIYSQHSWIALGDPNDPATVYVDYTAHAWPNLVDEVVVTTAGAACDAFSAGRPGHQVHRYDPRQIFDYGKPLADGGDGVPVALQVSPSPAQRFVEILGPLDAAGWIALAVGFPTGGWPFREILDAIVDQVPNAEMLIPIDVVGMGTDRNPGNLYW